MRSVEIKYGSRFWDLWFIVYNPGFMLAKELRRCGIWLLPGAGDAADAVQAVSLGFRSRFHGGIGYRVTEALRQDVLLLLMLMPLGC